MCVNLLVHLLQLVNIGATNHHITLSKTTQLFPSYIIIILSKNNKIMFHTLKGHTLKTSLKAEKIGQILTTVTTSVVTLPLQYKKD